MPCRWPWRPSWMGILHESGLGIWKIGYARHSWRSFVKEDVSRFRWWSEVAEKWGKMEHNSTQTRKFAGKFDGELWDLLGWYLKHEIHVSGRTLTRILVLAFWSKPKTCCLCMSSNACSIQSDFPIAIWCYHVPCGHVVCPRLAACSYRAQGWWGLRWVCEELPGCRWWRIKKESQLFSPGTHPPKKIKVLLEGLRVSWGPFLLLVGDGGLCL